MSPRVAPGLTVSIPLRSASCATSQTRRALTDGSPAKNIFEVSPCQPSLITVTSILRISPSLSFLSPGMPWQTTWLIEVQIDFGNPL